LIWYHKGQTSPFIKTSLVSPATHLLRLKIAPGTQVLQTSSAAEPAVESVADSVAESAESSSAAALSALRLRGGFGGRSFL
jgi:hypothetical protein